MELRDAYTRVFFEHADSINNALNDEHLRCLAALRNVIVHKAGVCDKEFIDEMKTVRQIPGFPATYNPGERLQLNGQGLFNLLLPALKSVVNLIKAVDVWLTCH